jgi:uncharacterized protein YggE
MNPRTIRVVGEAELKVAPDQVVFVLDFRADEKTVAKSKVAIEEQLKAVRAMLLRIGLDVKDLQVDRLSRGPKPGLMSYKIANDVSSVHRAATVTVRDLNRYEELLMLLMETDFAQLKAVEFQSSTLKHHRAEARTSALVHAREKAQAMAAVLNTKVDEVVSIEELPAGQPTDDGLEVGTLSVRASVQVTFSL